MIIKLFTDLLIYTFSFKLIETVKLGEIVIYSTYTPYLAVILLTMFLSSLINGKYGITKENRGVDNFKPLFKSLIISLGIITIYFNLFSDDHPSRLIISGSIILGYFNEFLFGMFTSRIKVNKKLKMRFNFSSTLFISEVILFLIIIALASYFTYTVNIKKGVVSISLLIVIWFTGSFFIHQFNPPSSYPNYWHFIWGRIKGYIIILALTSFMIYILIPENLSTIQHLYIAVNFSICSFIINNFYYFYRNKPQTDEPSTKFLKATTLLDEPLLNNKSKITGKHSIRGNPYSHYLAEQLLTVYLKKFREIFNFLDENLDLYTFDFRNSFMIKSSDTYNIEVMPENKLELYINLRELNDMQRINKYLKQVNSKLIEGGIFVGAVESLCLRRDRFFKKYPFYFAYIFYFFDFIWKRIFPKIPFLKRIYFGITKGRDRAISLSEIIGRIFFCGFDLINFKQIGNLVYFITVKKRKPLTDTNPSYGPFIKLKRIGQHGKTIYVYKFRTMYPYSEYLQNFVFEKANLKEGGKFKDDFRITSWGKVLRKIWLDEFPMFINLVKGQLKLIGVRPLSTHYFNLYPEELKKRRTKYKPGLVPPFYVDMPKTLEEIVASEEKYLCKYEKHPITTDVIYFFRAWYNILIKKARSE
jgi:lipopolysaccharide/colanic/teichoic acid biosynthesis glycosyltransferase